MSTGRLPSVDGGIQPTIVDAKGDLIVATAADTVSRLAVGSNDQVLTADSTTATGLKWASASSPAQSFTLLNAGGTALTGASTITVSSLSGYNYLYVRVVGAGSSSTPSLTLRFNSDSGSNYSAAGYWMGWGSSNTVTGNASSNDATTGIIFGQGASSSDVVNGRAFIQAANSTGVKTFQSWATGASSGNEGWFRFGHYAGSSVISSVSLVNGSTFNAGTIYVYGAN